MPLAPSARPLAHLATPKDAQKGPRRAAVLTMEFLSAFRRKTLREPEGDKGYRELVPEAQLHDLLLRRVARRRCDCIVEDGHPGRPPA